MKDILRKLSSRKLWVAISGIATGIAIAVGVEGNEITAVTGAVTALISAATYIITEGKIDAERVKTAVESTQTAVDVIEGVEDNGNS